MSIVEQSRKELERRGEYVVRANADSGWFAIFPKKVAACRELAAADGRPDFNLIIYRTKAGMERDHHVLPFQQVRQVFTADTLSTTAANGVHRWNCTLKNHQLHVTHGSGDTDVHAYYRQRLITESAHHPREGLPEEVEENREYREGSVVRVTVNRYERDATARARCIEIHGSACVICGFGFGRVYGVSMDGFIHVHHLIPLHAVGADYEVNPETDMVPVCPNCHAAIHSEDPPLTLDEVRKMMMAAKL